MLMKLGQQMLRKLGQQTLTNDSCFTQ